MADDERGRCEEVVCPTPVAGMTAALGGIEAVEGGVWWGVSYEVSTSSSS